MVKVAFWQLTQHIHTIIRESKARHSLEISANTTSSFHHLSHTIVRFWKSFFKTRYQQEEAEKWMGSFKLIVRQTICLRESMPHSMNNSKIRCSRRWADSPRSGFLVLHLPNGFHYSRLIIRLYNELNEKENPIIM